MSTENNHTIYSRLHASKTAIGIVKKNAKNPHFRNTYADLNALIAAVEPILLENGLLLLQPIRDGKVCTIIIEAATGEEMESCIDLPTNVTPQAMGSAITYYRRYTLQSLLSLQADDDDGQLASAPQPKPVVNDDQFSRTVDAYLNGNLEVFNKVRNNHQFTAAQEVEISEILNNN